mgnify:CR=1 FL=1
MEGMRDKTLNSHDKRKSQARVPGAAVCQFTVGSVVVCSAALLRARSLRQDILSLQLRLASHFKNGGERTVLLFFRFYHMVK